jgi:type II secretion system protein N
MTLTTRQKRVLRWVGLPILAVVTFVFTLHWTFPYKRLRQKLEDKLGQDYEVSIEDIKPGFLPGAMVISKVFLKTRPKKAQEKPTAIFVDKISADIGLLGILRGRYDVDIVAEIGGGKVDGTVVLSKAGIKAEFATRALPLQNIPGLRSAVGLPMEGGLNAQLALNLPKRKWREVDGYVKLSCPGCTVGDGVAKIKPKPLSDGKSSRRRRRGSVFAAAGVTVPRLDLGDVAGEIEIKRGVGTVKRFAARSADGEMTIDGEIRFKDPFKATTFPGCMRFKLSEALKKREKDFGNLPELMRVNVEEDGFANVAMTGTIGALRWRPRKKCAPIGGDRKRRDTRPMVTTRPEPKDVKPRTSIKPTDKPGTEIADKPTEPSVDTPDTSGPRLSKGGKKRVRGMRHGDDVGPTRPAARPIESPPGLAKPAGGEEGAEGEEGEEEEGGEEEEHEDGEEEGEDEGGEEDSGEEEPEGGDQGDDQGGEEYEP